MVQRTGEQRQGNIWFVQNNFYYDAFFLKAIGESSMKRPGLFSNVIIPVLNGGCPSGWCSTENNRRFHVRSSLKPWRFSNIPPAVRCELLWGNVQVHGTRHYWPEGSGSR